MPTATPRPADLPQQESADIYHSDPYAWSLEQADALRRRDFAAIDWDNVIEEIESVGRTEQGTWTSKCANAITHLLKIEHGMMATSDEVEGWEKEVQRYRREMAAVIVDNPRLQNLYPQMFQTAWQRGRSEAVDALAEYDVQRNLQPEKRSARKARRLSLPRSCPYQFHEVTAFTHDRNAAVHEPDSEVLPQQVSRALDYHRSRSQQWDR